MRLRHLGLATLLTVALWACAEPKDDSASDGTLTGPQFAVGSCNPGSPLPVSTSLAAPVGATNWAALVTRGFGDASTRKLASNSPPTTDQDDLHTGIDIAVGPGTAVLALGPGFVVSSGMAQGYGHAIVVEHVLSDGTAFTAVYGHLASQGLVPQCGLVASGQQIGVVGAKGKENGGVDPHLHFGIQMGHNVPNIRGYASRSIWPEQWCAPATFLRTLGHCSQGALRLIGSAYPGMLSQSFDLWLHDEDLQARLNVTAPFNPSADEGDVSVADDGRLVAFVSNRSGNDDIYVLDRGPDDIDVVTRVPASDPTLRDYHPAISADGRYILFNTVRPSTLEDLVLYDRKANKVVALPAGVNTPFQDSWPSISGDGRYLSYYASNSIEGLRVYDRARGMFLSLPPQLTRSVMPFSTLSGSGRYLAVTVWNASNQSPDIHLYDLTDPSFQSVDRLTAFNQAFPAKGPYALSYDGTVIAAQVFPSQQVVLYNRLVQRSVTASVPPLAYFGQRIALQCWPLTGAACIP